MDSFHYVYVTGKACTRTILIIPQILTADKIKFTLRTAFLSVKIEIICIVLKIEHEKSSQ